MPEALVKLVQTLAHSDAGEPIVAALQLLFIAIVYAHKRDNVLHKDRKHGKVHRDRTQKILCTLQVHSQQSCENIAGESFLEYKVDTCTGFGSFFAKGFSLKVRQLWYNQLYKNIPFLVNDVLACVLRGLSRSH